MDFVRAHWSRGHHNKPTLPPISGRCGVHFCLRIPARRRQHATRAPRRQITDIQLRPPRTRPCATEVAGMGKHWISQGAHADIQEWTAWRRRRSGANSIALYMRWPDGWGDRGGDEQNMIHVEGLGSTATITTTKHRVCSINRQQETTWAGEQVISIRPTIRWVL